MSHIPLIFIIAGEASGDQLGADLMDSLKELKDVRFAGIGGQAMAAQGLTSLFPMEELSLMGITGILRNLPHLLRRLRETVETIQQMKPEVVITIDAQEFSARIMKRLHKLPARPRLIQYGAPTVWAWRPGRARKIAAIVDRLLCLYPFEPPYFEKHGLKANFVGHPVARETARESHREQNLLCVLPGSRQSEIQTLLPIFGQTVALLQQEIPSLKVLIPTLPSMRHLVEQGTKGWSVDVHIVVGDEARRAAFQKASVALAASGTVALQLAAAGLPFVIAYKVGKINEWIGRAIIKTPWACMVNILLAFHTFEPGFVLNRKAKEKVKEPWIPEFIQDDCNPEVLTTALLTLLEDPNARNRQEHAMEEAIALLKAPAQAAAKSTLEEMNTPLQLRKNLPTL
ncbi:MAG: lipid-A-disaccharide synthase [Alphaproteobacteria bacterium]|nr:lipid-A-disaccharide synthase [Alphaproteobacteria bacterium]